MPLIPILIIGVVGFVAVVGAQVFAEPLPPAAGPAGPGACGQENPYSTGGVGRAAGAGARGAQAGAKFGPIGAAIGAILGWGRSVVSDVGGSIQHNVECRGQNQAGRVLPHAARDACKDRCDERYENHSLIGPGGRPWRECRQACNDAPDAAHGFVSPGMDVD